MIDTKGGFLVYEGLKDIAKGASIGATVGGAASSAWGVLVSAIFIRLSEEYRSLKRIYNHLIDLKYNEKDPKKKVELQKEMDIVKSKIDNLKKEATKNGIKWGSIIGAIPGAVLGGVIGNLKD